MKTLSAELHTGLSDVINLTYFKADVVNLQLFSLFFDNTEAGHQ